MTVDESVISPLLITEPMSVYVIIKGGPHCCLLYLKEDLTVCLCTCALLVQCLHVSVVYMSIMCVSGTSGVKTYSREGARVR